MTDFELDPNLEQFATERQWELLSAWSDCGSQRKAAGALGVSNRLFHYARDAVLKKAALRGYTPEYERFNAQGIPPGFVLKGQSVFTGPSGEVIGRWDKTGQEGMAPGDAKYIPDPKKLVKLSTMTNGEGRVMVQWASEKPELAQQETAWREFAKELAQEIPRLDPLPAPKVHADDLLAGYPVGDHHMGMYSWAEETGEDYDIEIGERLLTGAVDYLTNATGNAGQAVIAFLGDFMHYDSFESVTPTNRNLLDSDGRFPKMVQASVRSMRRAIDAALQAHLKVHVIVEIGNHDLASSIFLTECLRIAYEKEPRLSIDTSPSHYHYFRFGKVLLGTHHGHGTKMQNLPLTMAADRPEDWGASDYRYWWTGHIHKSKTQAAVSADDFSGCSVESFRVLPPMDAWAHQKGYRSRRDMKAIVYHRDYGETARHTINPVMLDASGN